MWDGKNFIGIDKLTVTEFWSEWVLVINCHGATNTRKRAVAKTKVAELGASRELLARTTVAAHWP